MQGLLKKKRKKVLTFFFCSFSDPAAIMSSQKSLQAQMALLKEHYSKEEKYGELIAPPVMVPQGKGDEGQN